MTIVARLTKTRIFVSNKQKKMSEFDSRAQDWDKIPYHWERAEAVAECFRGMVPINNQMTALEYGAGTGILSFLLSKEFLEITLMDNSEEMVKVMHEKVAASGLKNLKPLLFDLEHSNYPESKFDCIFSQMVLHHISDTEIFLDKCQRMLNPDGYLVVADLFTEDGTFHGPEAKVHLGFDPDDLSKKLQTMGFRTIKHKTCFIIKRHGKVYPLFLLVAKA